MNQDIHHRYSNTPKNSKKFTSYHNTKIYYSQANSIHPHPQTIPKSDLVSEKSGKPVLIPYSKAVSRADEKCRALNFKIFINIRVAEKEEKKGRKPGAPSGVSDRKYRWRAHS